MSATERAALEQLAEHALPEDAPGAWIRAAIAAMLAEDSSVAERASWLR
jgi:hypothetical protein